MNKIINKNQFSVAFFRSVKGITFTLLSLSILFIASCANNKDEVEGASESWPVPTVTTDTVTINFPDSVVASGVVVTDHGSMVMERGFCYATHRVPYATTGRDRVIKVGGGTGSFNTVIRGLTKDSVYFLRAYAWNGGGVGYGGEVRFVAK